MKSIRFLLPLMGLLALLACQPETSSSEASTPVAQEASPALAVIDAAIQAHGGERFDDIFFGFDFRGRAYTGSRKNGRFKYTRSFEQDNSLIIDVLTNEGLIRQRDGKAEALSLKDSAAYANSVNSVLYFNLVPYLLKDPAVNTELLESETINGQAYERVQVTFDEEGGGKDFTDVFVYWFAKEQHTLDYFAYSYETDGGGLRFRKAINRRNVEGLLFQDYINYKAIPSPEIEVRALAGMWAAGQLDSLSLIQNENIKILSEGN